MIKHDTLAPIILFVFNRLEHTINTLEALKKNILAKDSNLIIYSDAANKKEDCKKVNQVRKYISNISGFKSIKVIKRKKNYGLAKSIKNGITHVINKYRKAIILEDDILTSKFFLSFMNDSLSFYKNDKKIWHINGWNYPSFKVNKNDVYADRMMNCWGWSTWKDRWTKVNFDVNKILNKFNKKKIYEFNLNESENFYHHLLANKKEEIKTWAIFWQATIFLNKGLCIRPKVSYTHNIGFDNSGVHCSYLMINNYKNHRLNQKEKIKLIKFKKENAESIKSVMSFYKKNNFFFIRYINKCYYLLRKFIEKK
jgi:GT2 family glycosyltransferase